MRCDREMFDGAIKSYKRRAFLCAFFVCVCGSEHHNNVVGAYQAISCNLCARAGAI